MSPIIGGLIALAALVVLFLVIPLGLFRPRLAGCRSRGRVLGVYGPLFVGLIAAVAYLEPHLERGQRAMEQRDWEGAVTQFERVEAGDPGHAEARRLLAVAADSLWAPADSALRQKQWDRAAELIQQARRHEPLRARGDSAMRMVLLLRDVPAR